MSAMMYTAAVSKERLKGIFDVDSLPGTNYKVTITPVSQEEADEIAFKTLKGIAGRPLDVDEVKRERLGISQLSALCGGQNPATRNPS